MEERIILSVTQVNLYIKEKLENDVFMSNVTVKGEISNIKIHSSGHIYMSLKDEKGVIRAVMFRGNASKLTFKPDNGMKVVASGRISVYERDGNYQLYIDSMKQEGIGDLHIAFEKLKIQLSEEGLFDPKYKKPLPKYPKKVGVVTAPTGAAIRDIINVLTRRFSYSDVLLYPVLVQGENSAESIVSAIEWFNEKRAADVLIIGRGGGSIEDLWSFNEEIVARAIFKSEIPIVSAVGHEIDFTISDFVSDLRAPTPSAAAELVVPDERELISKFDNVLKRIKLCSSKILDNKRLNLKFYAEKNVLTNPESMINNQKIYLDSLYKSFENSISKIAEAKKKELSVLVSKLDGLSPLGTLSRGFSVTKDEKGNVLRSVKQVKKGDLLKVTLTDGEINTRVEE
ncbi:MAG: exodeoxyribonuclease VII large subunit [Clostridia bacterium]|nr:exodeoxyribonuclease VII large subunit [Clostridia bacterium]